jgi:hypothetical protein
MLLRKAAGFVAEDTEPGRGREIGDVNNERIEARPALGLVDAGNGARVGGVGGKAVNGLGRNGDRLARTISVAASAIASGPNGRISVLLPPSRRRYGKASVITR